MNKLEFKEDREILIYAFRYSLGRSSYSVSTMVNCIKDNWDILSHFDKELIQREILEQKEYSSLGMSIDKTLWESILELDIKENQ